MKKLFALVLALFVLALPVCAFAEEVSFIEPNYYPDYDVVEEAEETETAPKTGDFSMLPQLMMAAAAAWPLLASAPSNSIQNTGINALFRLAFFFRV